MLVLDVNILIDAFRQDAPAHPTVREWLDSHLRSREPVGLLPQVGASFLRIATNPRMPLADSPADARAFLDAAVMAPAAKVVSPAMGHWDVFRTLVDALDLVGNDVQDAYLAACAIDLGATFVTGDRGFSRFPGLRVLDPAT